MILKIVIAAIVVIILAGLAAVAPDLKRYLRLRSM